MEKKLYTQEKRILVYDFFYTWIFPVIEPDIDKGCYNPLQYPTVLWVLYFGHNINKHGHTQNSRIFPLDKKTESYIKSILFSF